MYYLHIESHIFYPLCRFVQLIVTKLLVKNIIYYPTFTANCVFLFYYYAH